MQSANSPNDKKTCFDYLFESFLKQACTVCQHYVSISCCDLCDVCTHANVLCMLIISFSCCVTLLLLERLKFYLISVMAVQFLIGFFTTLQITTSR